MRVMYLTWGETPRSYGVFNSQVLQQFIANKMHSDIDCVYHFVSAVPVIHSGLVREKFKYSSEIKKIKEILNCASITFKRLPIFSPQNVVNSSKNTFPFFHFCTHRLLLKEIKTFKADIVHCRSYHAAWAALKVREKYGLNYKVVFDGRGIWPYEIALKKGYADNSENLNLLLSIERYCLQEADSVVAVSETMARYYQSVYSRDIDIIFLSSDTNKLKPKSLEAADATEPHFCYVGALAKGTWHNPEALKALFQRLYFLFPSAKFTIVTTSSHDELKGVFSNFSGSITYKSTRTSDELKCILEEVDFGVMSYFTPESEREELLGSSVMAVKTAEYLSAGLPNIVNKYCGGAANVIYDYGVGIVYDPKCLDNISHSMIIKAMCVDVRNKALYLAKQKFDYNSNAIRYAKLYRRLI